MRNKDHKDKRGLKMFVNENCSEGVELIFKDIQYRFDSQLNLLNNKKNKIQNKIEKLTHKLQNTQGVDPDSTEAKILKRKMFVVSLLFILALLSEIFFAFKSLEGLSGLKSFAFFIAIVILPTLSTFLSLHFGLIPIRKRNLTQTGFEFLKGKIFLITGLITLTGFIILSIARAIAFADELLDIGFSENTMPLFFSAGFTISLIGSSLISGVLLFLLLDFYENEYVKLSKKQDISSKIQKLEREKETIENRITEIEAKKRETLIDLALKFLEYKTIKESSNNVGNPTPIPFCVQQILNTTINQTNNNQNNEEEIGFISLTNEGGEV